MRGWVYIQSLHWSIILSGKVGSSLLVPDCLRGGSIFNDFQDRHPDLTVGVDQG